MCVLTVLDYENVVETGSETEEEDRLLVSEEDGLLNGAGSPVSLVNHESAAPPSPALGHTLLRKTLDDEDDMKDSGIENVWNENDLLSASVDGTGEPRPLPCLKHAPSVEDTPLCERLCRNPLSALFNYGGVSVCASARFAEHPR